MEKEQRAHGRKALRAEAEVADVLGNTWGKVELLDVSQSGLAFLSPGEFGAGASRMVRFTLPNANTPLHMLCRVVHCTPHSFLSGYRVGTAIVRIEEADAQALAHFLA